MKSEYDVSIIIACYNEEKYLEGNVGEIKKVMDQTAYDYELIFVDDDSSDGTKIIIEKLIQETPNMQVIYHEKNIGRGGTVIDGILSSRGNIVGFIDIDLEVHARYIPSMILAINDGFDVATANRIYLYQQTGLFRHIMSRSYRLLTRIVLKHKLKDTETGFKFFKRDKILPVIHKTGNRKWFWDTEIMTLSDREGLNIIELPCLFIRRADKKSSVRVIHDTLQYIMDLYAFRKIINKYDKQN
jgi:glycosyltransferase involved in cell wall biosynthesis